jgi:hypothetical protein
LQLLPWDFWRLTPGEFLLRLDAFWRAHGQRLMPLPLDER